MRHTLEGLPHHRVVFRQRRQQARGAREYHCLSDGTDAFRCCAHLWSGKGTALRVPTVHICVQHRAQGPLNRGSELDRMIGLSPVRKWRLVHSFAEAKPPRSGGRVDDDRHDTRQFVSVTFLGLPHLRVWARLRSGVDPLSGSTADTHLGLPVPRAPQC